MLGQFQLELRRWQAAGFEHLAHGAHQIALTQLPSRQVDRDAQPGQAGPPPGHDLPRRLLQHPSAHRQDQACLLEHADENVGRGHGLAGTLPAQQDFRAADVSGLEVGLGLPGEFELAPFQGMAQFALELQTALRLFVEFDAVELHLVAAEFLGAVHGLVGVPQQIVGRARVVRVDRDPDAGADHDLVLAHQHRLLQCLLDALGNAQGVVGAAQRLGHDGELVAPQPRHGEALFQIGTAYGVTAPQGGPEPCRHLLQQPVAGVVPQAVVDVLEPVEVEEHQRHRLPAAARAGDGQTQAVAEQRSVGQTGQRVEVGQLLQLAFGQVAFGEVAQGGRPQVMPRMRHPRDRQFARKRPRWRPAVGLRLDLADGGRAVRQIDPARQRLPQDLLGRQAQQPAGSGIAVAHQAVVAVEQDAVVEGLDQRPQGRYRDVVPGGRAGCGSIRGRRTPPEQQRAGGRQPQQRAQGQRPAHRSRQDQGTAAVQRRSSGPRRPVRRGRRGGHQRTVRVGHAGQPAGHVVTGEALAGQRRPVRGRHLAAQPRQVGRQCRRRGVELLVQQAPAQAAEHRRRQQGEQGGRPQPGHALPCSRRAALRRGGGWGRGRRRHRLTSPAMSAVAAPS